MRLLKVSQFVYVVFSCVICLFALSSVCVTVCAAWNEA